MDPSVFTFRHLFSSCAEQFSLTKRKKPRSHSITLTVVQISIDCISHYRAILELVTLRSPSLGLSDRRCCGWKSGLFQCGCPLGANWER